MLSTRYLGLLAALCLLVCTGCQQDMAESPGYRPLEPSEIFPDRRSARPLVPGTVARNQGPGGLPESGFRPPEQQVLATSAVRFFGLEAIILNNVFQTELPFPVTEEVLERGRQRYNIYCAVCHDPVGRGVGVVVRRGFTHPPNLHTDPSRGLARRGFDDIPLRKVPLGYIYEVISRGYGAMPTYASQIPTEDRWKIAAYVRTLQFSQHAPQSLAAEKQP